MIRAAALILALATAMPAAAQVTTNCTSAGGYTSCQTLQQPSAGPVDYTMALRVQHFDLGAAMRDAEEIKALQLRNEAAQRGLSEQRSGRDLVSQAVGKLSGEHKCAEAKALALSGGFADIAASVVLYCDPP